MQYMYMYIHECKHIGCRATYVYMPDSTGNHIAQMGGLTVQLEVVDVHVASQRVIVLFYWNVNTRHKGRCIYLQQVAMINSQRD